jgi:hypothetical protein
MAHTLPDRAAAFAGGDRLTALLPVGNGDGPRLLVTLGGDPPQSAMTCGRKLLNYFAGSQGSTDALRVPGSRDMCDMS